MSVQERVSGRTSGSKDPVRNCSDPAAAAVKEGALNAASLAWEIKNSSEQFVSVAVPGSHAIRRVTIAGLRIGEKIQLRVVDVVPCERTAGRKIRLGDDRVSVLQSLVFTKELPVNAAPGKLKGSLHHIACVFTKVFLRSLHGLDRDKKVHPIP